MTTKKTADYQIRLSFHSKHYMNIITHKVSKAQRMKRLFNRLLTYSLPGIAAINIIDGILDHSRSKTLNSSIKSCKQLLELLNVNSNDTTYKAVFSTLKKIGYIAKIDGYYIVNPAVDTNLDRKQYEVIIQFYYELFKGTDFVLDSLEDLKRRAVIERLHEEVRKASKKNGGASLTDELYDLCQSLDNNEHCEAHDELYEIAFGEYDESTIARRKAVYEHYRNNCDDVIDKLINVHTQMLIELGFIYLEGTRYKYNYFECKSLSKIQSIKSTSVFLNNSFIEPPAPEYGTYPWYIKATDSERFQWLDGDSTNVLLYQEFNRRLKLLIP